MVLGEMATASSTYRGDDLAVHFHGDTSAALMTALATLASTAKERGLTLAPRQADATPPNRPVRPTSRELDGYLRAHADGTFTRVQGGAELPHEVPRSQADELRHLLRLRDITRALLEAEASAHEDTPEIADLRAQLNQSYDAYLHSYGPLNRYTLRRTGRIDPATGEPVMARIQPLRGGFRDDPYAPVVQALEEFEPVGQRAAKAAIFRERVIAPRAPRLGAETPADALAICLDSRGEANLAEVARLLGTSETDARAQLGTLVFDDPQSGRIVPAAEYLSGNVRDKLRAAEQAADDDPQFTANVAELRKVIPADLTAGRSTPGSAQPGSAPATSSSSCARLSTTPRCGLSTQAGRSGGRAATSAPSWPLPPGARRRYPAPRLAQAVLSSGKIEVRDNIDTRTVTRSVLNLDATLAAQEKATELAERFSDWAWEDPAARAELARIYNERFNSLVLRSYDDAGADRCPAWRSRSGPARIRPPRWRG